MQTKKGERVELLARRHGYFPASFRWRGRRFDVIAVERVWSERGPHRRRMFRVRSAAGHFLLEHTLAGDDWRVRRWPAALWCAGLCDASRPRYPLPPRRRRTRQNKPLLTRLAARLSAPRSPDLFGLLRRTRGWTLSALRS